MTTPRSELKASGLPTQPSSRTAGWKHGQTSNSNPVLHPTEVGGEQDREHSRRPDDDVEGTVAEEVGEPRALRPEMAQLL
jgi:hypothetical protein